MKLNQVMHSFGYVAGFCWGGRITMKLILVTDCDFWFSAGYKELVMSVEAPCIKVQPKLFESPD